MVHVHCQRQVTERRPQLDRTVVIKDLVEHELNWEDLLQVGLPQIISRKRQVRVEPQLADQVAVHFRLFNARDVLDPCRGRLHFHLVRLNSDRHEQRPHELVIERIVS